jgi:hypothetical protein
MLAAATLMTDYLYSIGQEMFVMDPSAYLTYLEPLQEQFSAAPSIFGELAFAQSEIDREIDQLILDGSAASIFDELTFWIVISVLVPIFIKFALVAVAYSAFKKHLGGDGRYRPGPLGAIGPFFGVPAYVQKTDEEIEAERQHAYKKWGMILCAVSIVGGLALFFAGIMGSTDVEISGVVILKNAAPGTILFVVGFLIWRQVHK